MRNKKPRNADNFTDFGYESYEEKKGRIKRVESEVRKKRAIRDWKKVWNENEDEYDEREEFFEKFVTVR